ncbi:MAG: hypothetical protein M3P40_09220, partial [Actinomycetota bacterium]|nr:hypothetical protein [Actinomycetota bacterium]
MRRLASLVVLLSLALATPASAQTAVAGSVEEAVTAFRSGDPVYVDPDARGRVPESQEEGLEQQIERAGGGIYLA